MLSAVITLSLMGWHSFSSSSPTRRLWLVRALDQLVSAPVVRALRAGRGNRATFGAGSFMSQGASACTSVFPDLSSALHQYLYQCILDYGLT